jgi:hypothetical protein
MMNTTESLPPPIVMTQLITGGVWITKSLYIAAKLGIADLVATRPQTAGELAQAAGAHAPSLYRVLRALASVGVFAEDETGRFHLTPLAETLQSSTRGSLRDMAIVWGAPWHWQAWGSLLHGVQTGATAWDHALGMSLFEYFMSHPDHFELFDGAMSGFSGLEAEAVAAAYDFSGIRTLVDVGGGHGLLLATILRANPHLRGVLYELPPVAEGARKLLAELEVLERCAIVAGDFFESIPAGGDAYIFKNIVHDFDDDRAIAILTNCRRAMSPQAKILLVQEALPTGNTASVGKLLDIQMLLIGGRERTASEYATLYAAAGFELTRLVPTPSPLHIIEGVVRQ